MAKNTFFQIKSYLKFLLSSTNEHGLHSPFLFDLATKCLYDKNQYQEYKLLQNYRQDLLSNDSVISIKDFGAGSRVFKSNERQIKKIAHNSGISAERAKVLFRIVQYFQPKEMLELGTSLGIATAALASGNENSQVISLEGCPETAAVATTQLKKHGFDNYEIIVGEFDAYLSTLPENKIFDLIYFDGNHQKEATLRYFDVLLKTASNDSIWIFDDIHWSPGMEEAWQNIKSHPRVTVTIDTFQWGIVFFRREQEKEHFIVRI
ncbi:MAG TPA: class I SAM-dependent methyltransferase [Flavobacterium sp.]